MQAGPLDELASARADLLRGQVAFAAGLGRDAPPLLLKAAHAAEAVAAPAPSRASPRPPALRRMATACGPRADIRTELRAAYQMLAAMGAEAFAERARRELLASGETVGKLAPQTRTELTAQEASIARLARDGLTNAEIGAQLFLSARTVK